ncbi:MAG: citrate synthase [Acidimicrobiales bacterium]
MLESEEAARRLGIKLATLYAYVSRGLLPSYPTSDSRRSLFDLDDVERLARRSRAGRRVETRLASVTTAVTQLREDGPAYRGRPVADLARTETFESVANLLFEATSGPDQGWQPVRLPRPPLMAASGRLCWAVMMCGARDPLRSDLRTEAVVRNARKVIATAVESLRDSVRPAAGTERAHRRPEAIAQRLGQCLTAQPSPAIVRAMDTALVVLADHELATSTMAVRIAASTRADVYDGLLAGLCTLAGPLHGGASELAHALLMQAERTGVEPALDSTLRWQKALPGFGHPLYSRGDPRFDILMSRVSEIATPEQRQILSTLVGLARAHAVPEPNVDLALAALTWVTNAPADAGRTIFSVARLAGWTAHYIEELSERPLRFRARAVYASNH